MDALWTMFRNVLVFIALAVPGYLFVKIGLLKKEQSGALSKLLMYLGMPFLIITSSLKIPFSGELTKWIVLVGVIGVLFTLLAVFVSAFLTKGEKLEKTRGMERFCAVFTNNGFLGLPLALAVFGADSLVMTYLIVLNIITNVLMYTFGVYLVSGDKKTINLKKAFLNPVLISFILGILLNLLKVNEHVPEVGTYSTHFSNIVTPISMTILGMKLGGVKLIKLFTSWKMYIVSLFKLIVLPAAGVAVLFAIDGLFDVGTEMIMGGFIAFAMPTAGLASTFSDEYDGDTENAVIFTLGTTVLSIATIPVLYALLNMMV